MTKRILCALLLFLFLFNTESRELLQVAGDFEGIDGYTYYRFLISEDEYAEIVRISSGGISVEEVLSRLDVKVVRYEEIGETRVFFGYVAGLSGLYILDGAPINLQIADNGGYIILGSPYIPDGF
ncbi:MAG: hypothetical protein LBQ40_06460 [Clostridiales bacterium]|nr:hypothetical protein [Clostridiales bacterium]